MPKPTLLFVTQIVERVDEKVPPKYDFNALQIMMVKTGHVNFDLHFVSKRCILFP